MIIRIAHQYIKRLCAPILLSMLTLVACEGTETRHKADNTVERLTGKDQVELMNQMKGDIDKIKATQSERLKQTD